MNDSTPNMLPSTSTRPRPAAGPIAPPPGEASPAVAVNITTSAKVPERRPAEQVQELAANPALATPVAVTINNGTGSANTGNPSAPKETEQKQGQARALPQTPAAKSPTPQEAAPAAAPTEPKLPSKPFTERVPENVAGMLCYLLGWISGLIFLLVDRRPFVRYHAAQSVIVFATLSLALLLLGNFFFATLLPHGQLWVMLQHVVEVVWVVAAVVLMLKANAGERPRVTHAAEFADHTANAKA